jgi:drug/metabolite transporter (DMT)-like permease
MLERKKVNLKKISVVLIIFPLLYAILDGLGTFLDSIYLDKLELVSEDSALICYEYTFLIYAILLLLIFKFKKKKKIVIKQEKDKIIAALLETAGQFFYVFAMAGHSVIAAPIVGSYTIVSLLLSKLILKEKLSRHKYVAIFIIVLGIVFLGIAEGLAD